MPAAEHQRSRPIERICQRQHRRPFRHQRQADQQQGEDQQKPQPDAPRPRKGLAARHSRTIPTQNQPRHRAQPDSTQLPPGAADQHHHENGDNGDNSAHPVRRQALRHAEHRLRHHGHGHQFQPMQHALRQRPVQRRRTQRKGHEQQRRWQGKACPGCQPAQRARPHRPQCEAHLARCRARQELAERHQIGIAGFADPAPPRHQLIAKIAQMRDGTAKARQAQLEEGPEHLAHTALPRPLAHACPRPVSVLFLIHQG